MIPYLVGSLAGSPYNRVNVFNPDLQLFSTNMVYRLRSLEFRRNRWGRELEYGVHPTDEFMYSALGMRFILDTERNRSRRDYKGFVASLNSFEEDFGELPEFSPRFLPALIAPLAMAAGSRDEVLAWTGAAINAVYDTLGVEAPDENVVSALEAYAVALNMLKLGEPLLGVCQYLETEYPSLNLYSVDDEIRETANDQGLTWENTVDLSRDDSILKAVSNTDVVRSVVAGLKAGVESQSVEEALRRAISLGGDSSVVAGIAGSVSEIIHCTPKQGVEYGKVEAFANEFQNRTFERLFLGFESVVSDCATMRRNLRELRAKESGRDAVSSQEAYQEDVDYASYHREGSESAYGEGESAVAQQERQLRVMPYDSVKVLRLGAALSERVFYLPSFEEYSKQNEPRGLEPKAMEERYTDFVKRMQARFGEANVVIGVDPQAALQGAVERWKSDEERKAGVNYPGGPEAWRREEGNIKGAFVPSKPKPQLLDRFFVPRMRLNTRGKSGDIHEVYRDSVVPVWQLLRTFYDDTSRFEGDVFRSMKEYGSLEKCSEKLKQLVDDKKKMTFEDYFEREAYQVQIDNAELAKVILTREAYGGWGPFVRKSFESFGTSVHARNVERSLEKECKALKNRLDKGPNSSMEDRNLLKDKWKEYFNAREARMALESAERFIPRFRVLVNAYESNRILSSVKRRIQDGFNEHFSDEARAFSSMQVLDMPEGAQVPVWYEELCDGLSLHHGDIVTGSLGIDSEKGRLVYNKDVDRGLTDQVGRVIGCPLDREPVEWITSHVRSSLFSEKTPDELREIQAKRDDAAKGGPYEYKEDDNIAALNDLVTRSNHPCLGENFKMSSGIKR